MVASSADNHNNCHFDCQRDCPNDFVVAGAIVNYTRHLVEPYPLSQSLSLPSFSSLRGNPIGQKHPKTRQLGVCSSALCWRYPPASSHSSRTLDLGGNSIPVHFDTTTTIHRLESSGEKAPTLWNLHALDDGLVDLGLCRIVKQLEKSLQKQSHENG